MTNDIYESEDITFGPLETSKTETVSFGDDAVMDHEIVIFDISVPVCPLVQESE